MDRWPLMPVYYSVWSETLNAPQRDEEVECDEDRRVALEGDFAVAGWDGNAGLGFRTGTVSQHRRVSHDAHEGITRLMHSRIATKHGEFAYDRKQSLER